MYLCFAPFSSIEMTLVGESHVRQRHGSAYHTFQLNFNQDTKVFIQENSRENVVCEIAAILSWGRCINLVLLN